jgi:hypothetical protein
MGTTIPLVSVKRHDTFLEGRKEEATSGLAVGLTELPIQCVPVLSSGVKG